MMQILFKVWFLKFNSSVKRDQDLFEKNPTVVLITINVWYILESENSLKIAYKIVKQFPFSRRSSASAQT